MLQISKHKLISSYFFQGNCNISILTAAENKITKKYGDIRKTSFLNGRYAAKQALKPFDLQDFSLLPNEDGAIIWPENFCGSISHTDEATIGIVSKKENFLSLGVDIENFNRCHEKLWTMLFTQPEIDFLNKIVETEKIKTATMLFSAKEAFYKCFHPIFKCWIGFQDIEVCADITANNLKFKSINSNFNKINSYNYEAKFEYYQNLVITYIAINQK